MRTVNSLGPTAQKVLLLLLGGLALGLSRSPRQQFRILKAIQHDWEIINRRRLNYTIKKLHHAKYITTTVDRNGSENIQLTREGRIKALAYQFEKMKIHTMKKWDGKWRMLLFDIPEDKKKTRDALCRVLKNMNFYQFQKSVFVHPFECQKEINFVREFFKLQPYLRFVIADKIDSEKQLKESFKI